MVPSAPDSGNICVYVAPDQDATAPPAGIKVQLVVVFGRPVRANQPQASPFTKAGIGVITNFVKGPITKNTTNGWFFVLDKIATKPTNDNLAHRYEFAVGVIVTDSANNVLRHFGEDPEMDIGR